MVDLDLLYTPAVTLARMIRTREISPVELIDKSLARIEEVNPKLNAFCFVYPEEAREKAKAAERAVMAGEPLGALHGLPIAIKDLTPTKGKRTTQGSFLREHWVPEEDAIVVERLIGAGAIMVGKTTTPEFAYSFFTRSPLWGITRNPWDPSRTPGGSSGGSAAAVATGCVAVAEGSDMGGSIRAPAAFCGLVGLKPGFARIPFEIFPSQFDSTCHFGPIARTVEDAALFLASAQGPDERDIQAFVPALRLPMPLPSDVRGLRLAFSPDLGYLPVDPEVEANARKAVAALRDLGAEVAEVNPGLTRAAEQANWAIWAVYYAAMFGHELERWRARMDPEFVDLVEQGLRTSAAEYKRTEFVRTEEWKKLRPILAEYHALLCPTMAVAAPGAEAKMAEFDRTDEQGRYYAFELTSPFNNVSQCPALTVPSGFTAGGLPTGLQIVGRRYDELTVLRIGKALEQASLGRARRPPI